MPANAWFAIVVLGWMVCAVGVIQLRRREEAPLRERIIGEPVVFQTQATVRKRELGSRGWSTLKSPAGGRLIVHTAGLEVTLPGHPGVLRYGDFMRAFDAVMWRDQDPLGRREGIWLQGFDGRCQREWAIIPRGLSIEQVWQALVSVGVSPSETM